jgi:hypothetical protein
LKRKKQPSQTTSSYQSTPPAPSHQNIPLKEVLTSRVVISIVNYALLAFLDICIRALQPLFYTSKITLGGLGFEPVTVGLCLAAFSIFSGLYQAFVFSSVYDRLGPKRVFVASMMAFIPIFVLFPLMNLSARRSGVNGVTWAIHTVQIVLYVLMDMGFS